MRLTQPRIPALAPDQWNEKAQEIMQPFVETGRDYNVFRTLMNHPALAQRWMVFANHILGKSSLPERERELLILRIGHLCNAGYEWNKHADISRFLGMSEEDINSSKTGPDTPGLSELDQLLLRATDELLRWMKGAQRLPAMTYVTHGEPSASDTLRGRIEHELGWPARAPEHLETIFLDRPR